VDAERHALELSPAQLRRVCDPESLTFVTTADLPQPQRMVGQERGQEAIAFALEMTEPRYNLFVAGAPGTGRNSAVTAEVERVARARPAAQDWCYVHNFDAPDEPRAIALPNGRARVFAQDTDAFVLACRRELRRAFAADAYAKHRAELLRDIELRRDALLTALEREALALGFIVQGTPSGLAVVPLRPASILDPTAGDGSRSGEPEPLTPEQYSALPAEERARIGANDERLQESIGRVLSQVHALEEQARQRVRELDHDVADLAVGHLADEFANQYQAFADVVEFARHLRTDIVAHADVLRGPAEASDREATQGTDASEGESPSDDDDDTAASDDRVPMDEGLRARPAMATLLRRYQVNALVARMPGQGAPVVRELNPKYVTLLGHTEVGLRGGLPFTDHLMIRAGALHRANGGFLILQASDLLSQPRSWDVIKRMLRFGTITVEGHGESTGAPIGAGLRPEPIPSNVKVVLVGQPEMYAALMEVDPDFRLLFKVRADFDVDMPRTRESEGAYACFVGQIARATGAPHFSREAVALIIEEGSRVAEDQGRLSALFGEVHDLAAEAGYWSRKEPSQATTRTHVEKALAARWRRQSLVSDRLDARIREGTLLIATSGEVVGQVNGLSVLASSTFSFGKPVRITARTSPGMAGVTNIEREIQMSGPMHSKGVLILAGYVAGRFGQDAPLSLAASVTFEQLYDEVDGDSASCGELYALLSSLSGLPIRQSLAVTGSVNQRGEVQAVGGVTEKVEAFFAICRDRGLTGEQGVIIPQANVRNLMLRHDVVQAAREGRFHVYAVSTIDEGIRLLTGVPAGQAGSDGRYLEGTVNARVQQTLRDYGERVRVFGLHTAVAGSGPYGSRAPGQLRTMRAWRRAH
jgi:lon-related putative ATP-dependent protease